MVSARPATGELSRGSAIAAGIGAGVVTLLLIAALSALLSGGDGDGSADAARRLGQPIALEALASGDCIQTGANTDQVILVSCTNPHSAEVTERLATPDEEATFPGQATLAGWATARCREPNENYVGTPILATTLDEGHLLPDFDDWTRGDTMVTCIVVDHSGAPLIGSVQDRGSDFARGNQVPVSRLMVGDCFTPPLGVDSYELNSSSLVDLADCEGSYNGVLFGRGALDTGIENDPYPGDESLSGLTGERCAALFETTYGVAANGFNYRFWRPNEQGWSQGDRMVLCSILDAEPLQGLFDPSRYETFFAVGVGTCFDLGPEETAQSLGLDDRVLEVPCTQLHTGQMIGSGLLNSDQVDLGDGSDEYPGDNEVESLAGTECEILFEGFVGISPYESELLRFPFWYPNETGWSQGDRRYACAFLHEAPRIGSLEGAEI